MNLLIAVPVLLLGLSAGSAKGDYETLCARPAPPEEPPPFEAQLALFVDAAKNSQGPAHDQLEALTHVSPEGQLKALRAWTREAHIDKCPLLDALEPRFKVDPITGCVPAYAYQRCSLDAVTPGLAEAWAKLPPRKNHNLALKKLDDRGLVEVGKLTDLTGLSIEDASGVSDLSPVHNLTHLTYLNMHHSAVTDLHALAGLKALYGLDLLDNPKLSSLVGIEPGALLDLNIKGTAVRDLTPLLTATRLQTVWLQDGVPGDQKSALAKANHNLQFEH